MPQNNNPEIIPGDTIRQNANILYGIDRPMLREYQGGLVNGDVNIQNHVDLSGVSSNWLRDQFAAQKAIRGSAPKSPPNRMARIMEDLKNARQKISNPTGNLKISPNIRERSVEIGVGDKVRGNADFSNKSGEIRYEGEIRRR